MNRIFVHADIMVAMFRMLMPIIVVFISIAVFYAARNAFGWTLGLRTYWPVFIAIFLFTWYVMSLGNQTILKSDDTDDDTV